MGTNTRAKMEFYGDVELIKKLEQLEEDVPKAIATSMKESAKIPADEMQAHMKAHHYSGRTERSFVFKDPVMEVGKKGKRIVMEFGYIMKRGGLGAVFQNWGGLHNPPTFFIQKAVDNNADAIAKAQNDTLKKLIGKLK